MMQAEEPPKAPLQQSMDQLGKFLSLVSFIIIGKFSPVSSSDHYAMLCLVSLRNVIRNLCRLKALKNAGSLVSSCGDQLIIFQKSLSLKSYQDKCFICS